MYDSDYDGLNSCEPLFRTKEEVEAWNRCAEAMVRKFGDHCSKVESDRFWKAYRGKEEDSNMSDKQQQYEDIPRDKALGLMVDGEVLLTKLTSPEYELRWNSKRDEYECRSTNGEHEWTKFYGVHLHDKFRPIRKAPMSYIDYEVFEDGGKLMFNGGTPRTWLTHAPNRSNFAGYVYDLDGSEYVRGELIMWTDKETLYAFHRKGYMSVRPIAVRFNRNPDGKEEEL